MSTVTVRHATLQRWAESIVKHGPDPHFRLPNEGQGTRAEGLSCYRADETEFIYGLLEDYAYGKERDFPEFGGPVILEFDVPEDLAERAGEFGEVRFIGETMAELRRIWSTVKQTARIVTLEPRS